MYSYLQCSHFTEYFTVGSNTFLGPQITRSDDGAIAHLDLGRHPRSASFTGAFDRPSDLVGSAVSARV